MTRRRHGLVVAGLLLGFAPLLVAGHPSNALRLRAAIEHGDLVAVLSNASDRPVKTVGTHVSPIPGAGGFYVRLRDAGGNLVKYCGMIDGANPNEHVLGPHRTMVYRNAIGSLANQYCLRAGRYTLQVVYFNALPFGGAVDSGPVASGDVEIVVPNASD